MSPRVWDKWLSWGFKRFPEYASQISVYMHAEALRRRVPFVEATYAIFNRETEELELRTLTELPSSIEAIFQKVLLAEQFAVMHQLPTCDSASEYPCSFSYLCDKADILFEEIEQGAEDTVQRLCVEHAEIGKTIEKLTEKKEGIRNEIRTVLAGRDSLRIDGWSISNKPQKTNRLNLVRLREVMGDELDTYFTEETTDPRLVIRATKRVEEE
jgi:hypothetical protein